MTELHEEVYVRNILEAIDFVTDSLKRICADHDRVFEECRFRVKEYSNRHGDWLVRLSGLRGTAEGFDFEVSQQAWAKEIYAVMYKRVGLLTATTGAAKLYVPGVTPIKYDLDKK